MAIKSRDGPTSDLLSLNYILTSLNSYVFGVVLSLAKSISAQCYGETEIGPGGHIAIKSHDGPNSDLLALNYI